MQLHHELSVPAGRADTWDLLTDIECIATCLPGAHVDETRQDGFDGRFAVKAGAIGVEYAGSARFVERDVGEGRIVLGVQGRERRGNGAASATLIATIREVDATRTTVDLKTEFDVTGRAAQLGGPILTQVADRLVTQFAANLERTAAPDAEVTEARVPRMRAGLACAALALVALVAAVIRFRTRQEAANVRR